MWCGPVPVPAAVARQLPPWDTGAGAAGTACRGYCIAPHSHAAHGLELHKWRAWRMEHGRIVSTAGTAASGVA